MEDSIEFEDNETLKIVFYSFLEKLQKEGILDQIKPEDLFKELSKYPSISENTEPNELSIDTYIDETLMHWGYRLREEDRIETVRFQNNLEKIYGYIFYHLDLIYLLTIQLGVFINDQLQKNDLIEENYLNSLIIKQHVRACSILAETIHLLKGGFGTGAMVRYRSLHELVVTMEFIYKNGQDAAEAYYDYIDVMKAKDAKYLKSLYGEKQDIKESLDHYHSNIKPVLTKKHGKEFANIHSRDDAIWARKFLNLKPGQKPSFNQIRNSVKRAHGREQYKFSSNSIHSAPKSIISSLGHAEFLPIAGASNIGIAEPGAWSIYELVNFNSILCQLLVDNSDSVEFDPFSTLEALFSQRLIMKLAGYVSSNFSKIEKEILDDEKDTNMKE